MALLDVYHINASKYYIDSIKPLMMHTLSQLPFFLPLLPINKCVNYARRGLSDLLTGTS